MKNKMIALLILFFPLFAIAEDSIDDIETTAFNRVENLVISSSWIDDYLVSQLSINPTPYVYTTGAVGGASAATATILTPTIVALSVAGGAVATAAAIGGGGGGSSSSSEASAPAEVFHAKEYYETDEYNAQYALATINASDAYALNYNGSGVNIAVHDSGINYKHSDLSSRVKGCYDPITGLNYCDSIDIGTHGTHVAGIIGASKNDSGMHGVAYNANLYSVDIMSASISQEAKAINYSVNNFSADIINNSYCWLEDGSATDCLLSDTNDAINLASSLKSETYYNALENALTNKTFMVWAAGNDAHTEPTFNSALPIFNGYEKFEDIWIAVVATDTNGEIAGWSNKCGEAKDFCIAAPGVDIYSTSGDTYENKSGTSMAAPIVSGGIALLIDKFDGVPIEQIRERLFLTADKDIVGYSEEIYGHGIMDLEKATNPIGPTSLALGGNINQIAPLENSNIEVGSPIGNSLANALRNINIMALDSMNFPFYLNAGNFITSPNKHSFKNYFDKATSFEQKNELNLDEGKLVTALKQDNNKEQSLIVESFALSYQTSKNTNLEIGYNETPATRLGLYGSNVLSPNLIHLDSSFANPFLSNFDDGYSLGFNTGFDNNQITFLFFNHNNASTSNNGFLSAIKTPLKTGFLSFEIGALQEKESFLGSKTTGAFAIGENNHTWFNGINFATNITNDYGLVASLYNGITSPKTIGNSIIKKVSTINSQSWSIGLTKKALFNDDDKLILFANQPLAVTNGNATLSIPVKRTYDNQIINQEINANLAPQDKQLTLGLSYDLIADNNNSMTFGLGHTINSGNDGYNSNDNYATLGFKFSF